MKMRNLNEIICITGNVSSGKTTLAKKLLETIPNVIHLSSDEIRTKQLGDPAKRGGNVFGEMRQRLEEGLKNKKIIILDATPMSEKFRAIIKDYRDKIFLVHLKNDYNSFKEREKTRDDRYKIENGERMSFEMPDDAFKNSSNFDLESDLFLNTTNLTPEQVFTIVMNVNNKKCNN